MNIHTPVISRALAILIGTVHPEERTRFIEDAEKASDIGEFIKGMGKYKPISEDLVS